MRTTFLAKAVLRLATTEIVTIAQGNGRSTSLAKLQFWSGDAGSTPA